MSNLNLIIMKKSVLKIAFIAMTGLVLTSCALSKQGSNKNIDVIMTPVISQPKVLEYQVNFDAKATATLEKKMRRGETQEMYIDLALSEAIAKSNCDFIFEPSINVETKGRLARKRINVRVSGYPGVYTGTKNVDYSDTTQVINYIRLSTMNSMKRGLQIEDGGSGLERKRLRERMKSRKNNN